VTGCRRTAGTGSLADLLRSSLDDPQIVQLYLYIKARSDGRLATGRPASGCDHK
jgi:hypothetical protein